MSDKKIKKFVLFVVVLLLSSLPLCFASISNNYGNIPQIDQWSNWSFPTGTHSNITRIGGIWYIDGYIFPTPSMPTVTLASTPIPALVVGPAWTNSSNQSSTSSADPSRPVGPACSGSNNPTPFKGYTAPVSFESDNLFWVVVSVISVVTLGVFTLFVYLRRRINKRSDDLFEGASKPIKESFL